MSPSQPLPKLDSFHLSTHTRQTVEAYFYKQLIMMAEMSILSTIPGMTPEMSHEIKGSVQALNAAHTREFYCAEDPGMDRLLKAIGKQLPMQLADDFYWLTAEKEQVLRDSLQHDHFSRFCAKECVIAYFGLAGKSPRAYVRIANTVGHTTEYVRTAIDSALLHLRNRLLRLYIRDHQLKPADISVRCIGLPTRTRNTIARAKHYDTVADFLAKTSEQLLHDIPGFGHRGLTELQDALAILGYALF